MSESKNKSEIKRFIIKLIAITFAIIIIINVTFNLIFADKLENIVFDGRKFDVYYYDKYGNLVEKPVFNKEISSDLTAADILEKYITEIGGNEKLSAINTISIEANVTIPGAPFKPKAIIIEKSPNLSSLVMSVEGMGTLMTQKFDGESGYMEQMGQKIPMEKEQIDNSKNKESLFD